MICHLNHYGGKKKVIKLQCTDNWNCENTISARARLAVYNSVCATKINMKNIVKFVLLLELLCFVTILTWKHLAVNNVENNPSLSIKN